MPSRCNPLDVIRSWSYLHQVRDVKDGLVSADHPEILVDHTRNVSSSKEPIFMLSLLLLQEDHFLEIRGLNFPSSVLW